MFYSWYDKAHYCPLVVGGAETCQWHYTQVYQIHWHQVTSTENVDQQQLHNALLWPTWIPSDCGCYLCENNWTTHYWQPCFHGVVINCLNAQPTRPDSPQVNPKNTCSTGTKLKCCQATNLLATYTLWDVWENKFLCYYLKKGCS